MPVDGEDECVGAEAHAAREREANEMQRVRGGGGDAGGEMKEAKGGGGERWRREEVAEVRGGGGKRWEEVAEGRAHAR